MVLLRQSGNPQLGLDPDAPLRVVDNRALQHQRPDDMVPDSWFSWAFGLLV